MRWKRLTVAGVAAGILVVLAAGLHAQEAPKSPDPAPQAKTDRIALTVEGHARAPADEVSVEFVVLAQAEVAADVEPLHRAKLRSVLEALDELGKRFAEEARGKAPGSDEPPPFTVELEERGSMVNVTGYMAGQPRTRAVSTVQLATVVACRMKGIASCSHVKLRKRLLRIVDVAIDSGAELGAPDARLRPAFRFQPKDAEALREQAYKEGLDLARERASRLARLANRDLGPVSGVTEAAWSVRGNRSDYRGPQNQNQPYPWRDAAHQQRRADAQGVAALMSPIDEATTTMTEVEIEVTLAVEYELGKVQQR
jgi:uncharacterized protein YggE